MRPLRSLPSAGKGSQVRFRHERVWCQRDHLRAGPILVDHLTTVMNPLAGTLRLPAAASGLWQVVGGLVWSFGVVLAGYGLGSPGPSTDRHLLPVIALIVVVSLVPVLLEIRRRRLEGTR